MTLYTPDWESLRTHRTPKWLQDDKFGIYTHWGIYSVPACGPNGTWYAHQMYRSGGGKGDQAGYHEKTYGPASEFGYKDFIPMFTAEKFDADEWAEVIKSSGARFAGPVAEHHDGFSMWDSNVNEWNSARMGPKRDITRELEKAYRAQGMRFMVALHHARIGAVIATYRIRNTRDSTASCTTLTAWNREHNQDGRTGPRKTGPVRRSSTCGARRLMN
jgi:alpha-L-fucosidase